MIYQIEKGVPIPEFHFNLWKKHTDRAPGGKQKYPLGTLEVGDSFVIKTPRTRLKGVREVVSLFGRRNNKKFFAYYTDDGHIRVWRYE